MSSLPDNAASLSSLPFPLAPEDQARADLYALIGRLLLAAPDPQFLGSLSYADSLSGRADDPLDSAWEELVLATQLLDQEAIREEFNTLFVSIGMPPVNPYASLYLAGFMMEKPLAALRSDLAELGLARIAGASETEDHLGALCETMRILISGAQHMPPQSLQLQKNFFMKHIASWHVRLLADLRKAEGANFYRLVADFAQAFFEIEYQAFEIEGYSSDKYLLS